MVLMFRSGFRLPFKLLGIPLHVDVTFLIILPLLAWTIGRDLTNYIQLLQLGINPGELDEGLTPYVIGLVAALGLFAGVVIHELGHAIVARGYSVKVKSITLWVLGGMAQFEEIPRRRWAEAVIAIAGPITSFILAGLCWATVRLFSINAAAPLFVFGYLAFMNMVLGLFNLLPALPLDGGRVLRSVLAARLNYLRATQISADVSKFMAILLGIFGFISFNIFLMLIAFFIYMAIGLETQMAVIAEVLDGIRVSDVMRRNVQTVLPEMHVPELIQKMFRERFLGYPVVDASNRLVGMVSLRDLQKVKESNNLKESTQVADIMSPQLNTVPESSSALEAFQRMSRNDFERLVVLGESGKMIGILSKTDLMRAIQVRLVGSAFEPHPALHEDSVARA